MLVRIPRRAATLVEFGVVSLALLLLLLVVIVGSLGVYRSHQVSAVAREAARYASVHGALYAQDPQNAGKSPASSSDIYNYAAGLGAGLHLQPGDVVVKLKTYEDASGKPTTSLQTFPWDSSDKYPYVVTDNNGATKSALVTVTVTYVWIPGMLGAGNVAMQSTAEVPMSY